MQASEERAVVLPNWPQPATVAEPRIRADDSSLSIRYRSEDEKTVVVRFRLCSYLIFGAPNDEALGGHPLANRGLEFYSVHEVVHSSIIQMLERRNSIHPRHDRDLFLRDKKHYLFTFQDSTLECVVNEGEWWRPAILVFDSDLEVDGEWNYQSP